MSAARPGAEAAPPPPVVLRRRAYADMEAFIRAVQDASSSMFTDELQRRTLRVWLIYQFCWLQVMPRQAHPMLPHFPKPGYYIQVRKASAMGYKQLLPERWAENQRRLAESGDQAMRPFLHKFTTEEPLPERQQQMAADEMSLRALITLDSGPSLHLLLLVPRDPALIYDALWANLRRTVLPALQGGRVGNPAELQRQGGLLTDRCAACASKPADGGKLLKCAACLSVYYCSNECQRQHWSTHKPFCREIQAGMKAASEHSKRARERRGGPSCTAVCIALCVALCIALFALYL